MWLTSDVAAKIAAKQQAVQAKDPLLAVFAAFFASTVQSAFDAMAAAMQANGRNVASSVKGTVATFVVTNGSALEMTYELARGTGKLVTSSVKPSVVTTVKAPGFTTFAEVPRPAFSVDATTADDITADMLASYQPQ
jgi:hypothetical protein